MPPTNPKDLPLWLRIASMGRLKPSWSWWLIGVMFVVFGIGFFLGVGLLTYQTVLDAFGEEANGQVIDTTSRRSYNSRGGGWRTTYHIEYTFEVLDRPYANKQEVTSALYFSYDFLDSIMVTYLPQYPNINRVERTIGVRTAWIVTIVFGVFFLLAVYLMVANIIIARRQTSTLTD